MVISTFVLLSWQFFELSIIIYLLTYCKRDMIYRTTTPVDHFNDTGLRRKLSHLRNILPPTEKDGHKVYCRHIISVFKLVQDLLASARQGQKSQFQLLMEKLPLRPHKAPLVCGIRGQAMVSVLSTVLSHLNAFLDSKMEQNLH